MDTHYDRLTVLIADDEVPILNSFRRLLRKEPYRVLFASSAAEALELLRDIPVDILLSDQRMPGKTGLELIREIREVSPSTYRIMLTGYADSSLLKDALSDGTLDRIYRKPWEGIAVRSTLLECCELVRLRKAGVVA